WLCRLRTVSASIRRQSNVSPRISRQPANAEVGAAAPGGADKFSHGQGVRGGVVVVGGNIFRGVEVSARGVPRPVGDTMGMLATVMNCLVLEAAVERAGCEARTLSALAMTAVCETYNRKRAMKNLGKGRVVLLAAGTGNPFFTTDTTAVLRAAEL